MCNQETDAKTSYNIQKRYRSGVGSLLYLVKHLQPKFSNTVHELFKNMDRSNTSHYKELLRTIKYVIDQQYYCEQMKLDRNINGTWELRGYSDTAYIVDNDNLKKC